LPLHAEAGSAITEDSNGRAHRRAVPFGTPPAHLRDL